MRVSVIVPAFNEERLLSETLRTIKTAMGRFDARKWDAELIVCDNNSTDRTAEIARGAGATVVFEPINQIGRARNAGAAAASGDWLIFVDADSHPTPELFEGVAEHIQGGKCLAGGATVRLEGDYPLAKKVIWLWNLISRTCRMMAGSFIFCEARAFKEVGGFNNELFATEELDLSRKLKTLARRERRKIVILDGYPLLTSGRKMHLYTAREHIAFLARTILGGGRTLTSREACHTWYDGRR
jgi:glycosyltransferase involved in cell wall biosynthesis